MSIEELQNSKSSENQVKTIAMLVFFLFIGLKLGFASVLKEKTYNGSLNFSTSLILSDDKVKNVYLLGMNSTYIFYVNEGEKNASIMPIADNIKEIKKK